MLKAVVFDWFKLLVGVVKLAVKYGRYHLNDPEKSGDQIDQDWVKFTTQLSSKEIKRKFKAQCASEDVDMREVIDALIKAWLKDR